MIHVRTNGKPARAGLCRKSKNRVAEHGVLTAGKKERGSRSPSHGAGGVVEDGFRLAAELNEDHLATIESPAGNEAAPGRVGVTRLHSVERGRAAKQKIGRFEDRDASAVVAESTFALEHQLSEDRVAISVKSDARHVSGGGILRGREAVAVREVGGIGADGCRRGVHLFGKGGFRSTVVAGEGGAGVVHAFHHHRLEKLAARIAFADLEVELGWLGAGFWFGDRHDLIKVSGAGDNQSGEEFLGAGDGAMGISLLLKKNLTASGIDKNGGLREDFRGVCRPNLGCTCWRFGDG